MTRNNRDEEARLAAVELLTWPVVLADELAAGPDRRAAEPYAGLDERLRACVCDLARMVRAVVGAAPFDC